MSSLSASSGGPSCAGRRWWKCGESGREGGEGGCSAGRLAPREAAGSERALWQTALVPGLTFVSLEMQLG